MASAETTVTNQRTYWSDEIAKSGRRYENFLNAGEQVQNRYRLEENAETEKALYKDRYNILYSSTETTKPSLYAQTPKVQATKRHRDRENETVTMATMLLESVGQYAIEEVDFDGVMKNVVQDYLLPGMGVAWVRYVPTIRSEGEGDDAVETVDFEGLDLDYVNYRDFRTGVGRTWKELPWVARRVYFAKKKAIKRFGKDIADKLVYSHNRKPDDESTLPGHDKGGALQAVIWEIWDKENREVVWYSDDYPDDVLDKKPDPLKLRDFFPCAEPVRAVWTTRSFVPKAFYSQYKAQAEELDNITERIRYLTEALRVIGVYDGSQTQLANLLTGRGNKLVPIENWTMYAQNGGMSGSIQYVPIKEVAEVLNGLYQQREIAKGEIYEITGFSDIVRGVSKASETLGAQKIKSDWAGGRLRDMQKDIQRFCRDTIRIMVEIAAEHFSTESLALYAGFDPPPVTDEEQAAAAQYAMAKAQFPQAQAQYANALTLPPQPGAPPPQPPQPPQPPPPTLRQQAVEKFNEVVALLKKEKQRAAVIGIETDSTIAPDESAEREDRMQFLSSAGAFLQQAGPMALQFPDMRGLLGAILMFTIRTFRSSRPLEKEFEAFTKKLAEAPPMQPPGSGTGEGGGTDPAAAQAEQATAQAEIQAKQQSDQAKVQADQQTAAQKAELDRYKIDTDAALERERMQLENSTKLRELALREREVAVKEAELGLKRDQADVEADLAEADQAHRHELDGAQFNASREDADRAAKAPKPNKGT